MRATRAPRRLATSSPELRARPTISRGQNRKNGPWRAPCGCRAVYPVVRWPPAYGQGWKPGWRAGSRAGGRAAGWRMCRTSGTCGSTLAHSSPDIQRPEVEVIPCGHVRSVEAVSICCALASRQAARLARHGAVGRDHLPARPATPATPRLPRVLSTAHAQRCQHALPVLAHGMAAPRSDRRPHHVRTAKQDRSGTGTARASRHRSRSRGAWCDAMMHAMTRADADAMRCTTLMPCTR